MTLRMRRLIPILAVITLAGSATATHEGFQWPPEEEQFSLGIGTQFPPGIQAKRDAITGPAEVYMFRGFLAHGVPPAYNTPVELAENIEAVRATQGGVWTRNESGV